MLQAFDLISQMYHYGEDDMRFNVEKYIASLEYSGAHQGAPLTPFLPQKTQPVANAGGPAGKLLLLHNRNKPRMNASVLT